MFTCLVLIPGGWDTKLTICETLLYSCLVGLVSGLADQGWLVGRLGSFTTLVDWSVIDGGDRILRNAPGSLVAFCPAFV